MIEYILFILGIFLIVKSADLLIDGSSALAKKLGISSLVVGLTIIAFGTSLPELIINVIASINNKPDIAVGNIIGSNIANILLILGISSIIYKLKIQKSTMTKEIPFSFLAAILLLLFALKPFLISSSSTIDRMDGIILFMFFGIFMYYVYEIMIKDRGQIKKEKKETEKIKNIHSNKKITLMIIFGLIGLYFGGKWVVDGASAFAKLIGLSEFLISATIIAIGTSLPELITSIVATLKKESDMAIGNIIGSNIFNVFLILGISATINPLTIKKEAITDIIFLIFITIILFIFIFTNKNIKKKENNLVKWHGIVFIVLYILYITFLIIRG